MIAFSHQELNERMLQQGYNKTHVYKPDYWSHTGRVLFSPTPVVRLQELTMAKLFNAIRYSTASGKSNYHCRDIKDHESYAGHTDLHYSTETSHPTWYAYALRNWAPYKKKFDQWSVK